MIAALLAVAASVAYGASDLTAGLTARRTTALAVAWWAHVVGVVLLLTLAVAIDGRPPVAGLLFGLGAGAITGLGLLFYYGALAAGPVSVVTPLAASGVAIPVLVGVFSGQAPGPLGWVGLALTATGVFIVARSRAKSDEPTPSCPGGRPSCPEEQGSFGPRLPPVLGALLGAASFGTSFVLVGIGGQGGSQLWVAAGLQTGGLLALLPVLLAGSLRRAAVPREARPLLAVTALLVAAGDASLALALGRGELATVSVLGSLDSVVSVLLARLLLMEHLARLQALGVVATISGAILLGTG